MTHASCSTLHFCEVVDAWPIGLGHPCFGCTEKSVAFTMPMLKPAEIVRPTPPATYAPVTAPQGFISPIATGLGGLLVGGILGGGWMASRKLAVKQEGAAEKKADTTGTSGKE